jgi:HprK-related kinase A
MAFTCDLSHQELRDRLREGQFALQVGPYTYSLQSNLTVVAHGIEALYRDFPLAREGEFIDYCIALNHKNLLSRLRGQVDFFFENQRPFGSIPLQQAYAFVEWGMNWCISYHANEYLKLHAAVVARDGSAIIMPGVPGAGKSTLCAALGLSGWRVLSDEHAMVLPGSSNIVPLCRPVSLKNESIPLIRSLSPNAVLGPISEDTHKGVVAHLKADFTPDSHNDDSLPANTMLFPKYSREEPQQLRPRSRSESFILAAYHSFNYSLMGASGFHAMCHLIDSVECFDLIYHDIDWAIHCVNRLHEGNWG